MPLAPLKLSDLTYTFSTSNEILREEWRDGETLHSVEDHPAVIISTLNSQEEPVILENQWYAQGMRHRPEINGPAWIKMDDKGEPLQYIYYNTGLIHRSDGPAFISNGVTKYYKHGELDRRDGPAVILETDKGTTYRWCMNGVTFDDIDHWGLSTLVDDEIYTYLKLYYV